jgi:predicted amidohydrolase
MKIGVAQTRPHKGDIAPNIEAHLKLIELASEFKTQAIFFPELSLTGYEPELAKELAIDPSDSKLDIFQETSNNRGITIGVGMPTQSSNGIHISMLVFQPTLPRLNYSKQILHKDELPFFTEGEGQIVISVENKKIIPSICYESLHEQHAEYAHLLGGEIYLASVAKSEIGVSKAVVHYADIAERYAMPVLMSNCVGFCDNFMSVGQSAVLTKEGKLAGQLGRDTEGVLVYDTKTEEVEILFKI